MYPLNQHVDAVITFMSKAGQDTPEKISTPSKESLIRRANLILEEAFELINNGLGVEIHMNEYILNPKKFALKSVKEPDIIEAMDGAADLMWTGVTGVAIDFGCKLDPVLEEVDNSNLSKFVDGHRREDGKWIKGPSYKPADIKSVLKDRVDG